MNPCVKTFDGPLRFHVASRSRPDGTAEEVWHLVQLDAFNNNGACSCELFDMRMRKDLEDGGEKSESTRCFHIKQAREEFCDRMLELIARAGEPTPEEFLPTTPPKNEQNSKITLPKKAGPELPQPRNLPLVRQRQTAPATQAGRRAPEDW